MNSHSTYSEMLAEQLAAVHPGSFRLLEKLDVLPEDASIRIAAVVLGFACQAQNDGAILAGRAAFARMPRPWLLEHLQQAVAEALDLNDEWEYRRLLELIQGSIPELIDSYIAIGLESKNPEVTEAASDFCR